MSRMFFRHWFLHGWLVVVLGSKRTLIFHRQRNMASSVVSSQGETPTDGEEDEQSEVLFRTFVKIKAEKEQKNEIKAAVEDEADPEEAAQVNEERNKEIGSRLASIADEIDEEYKTEIDDMIEQLQLTSENAYDNFSLLATRLLARGVTWGHIVALFLFGYRIIVRFFTENIPDLIRRMAGMIGRFFAEKVSQWVKDNGGWMHVLTLGYFNVHGLQWMRYVGGAVFGLLGVAILFSLWKK